MSVTCRVVVLVWLAGAGLAGQVHYHEDGRPWRQRAGKGPDGDVPGWFYNLGITGLRVELVAEEPDHLVVRHVFEGSPAAGRLAVDDVIEGAGGEAFREPHRNGYGMEVFGARGPIGEFAQALEECQGKDGKLVLRVRRGARRRKVTLSVGTRYGRFGKEFPEDCPKSRRILGELLDFLRKSQRADGSWGNVVPNTFAPLALMAAGRKEDRAAIQEAVRFHAKTTRARDDGGLIHWRYMAAAIVLGEYWLETGAKWVLPELGEIRDFILHTQYVSLDQVNPRVKETHPGSWPKTDREQHGGWGHNPGFEGYGPICMVTGQGALALAMIKRCGLPVPRKRHDAAYEFLARGTGRNGYVWYEDEVAGHEKWADLGRTGAAALANLLSPYEDGPYRKRARAHLECIGAHPESFPDTHGSPVMGMGYVALAAWSDAKAWRRLLDANRWWFALAQCPDGSFYYQPNRDNAGYGPENRVLASSAVALILALPGRRLQLAESGRRQ